MNGIIKNLLESIIALDARKANIIIKSLSIYIYKEEGSVSYEGQGLGFNKTI